MAFFKKRMLIIVFISLCVYSFAQEISESPDIPVLDAKTKQSIDTSRAAATKASATLKIVEDTLAEKTLALEDLQAIIEEKTSVLQFMADRVAEVTDATKAAAAEVKNASAEDKAVKKEDYEVAKEAEATAKTEYNTALKDLKATEKEIAAAEKAIAASEKAVQKARKSFEKENNKLLELTQKAGVDLETLQVEEVANPAPKPNTPVVSQIPETAQFDTISPKRQMVLQEKLNKASAKLIAAQELTALSADQVKNAEALVADMEAVYAEVEARVEEAKIVQEAALKAIADKKFAKKNKGLYEQVEKLKKSIEADSVLLSEKQAVANEVFFPEAEAQVIIAREKVESFATFLDELILAAADIPKEEKDQKTAKEDEIKAAKKEFKGIEKELQNAEKVAAKATKELNKIQLEITKLESNIAQTTEKLTAAETQIKQMEEIAPEGEILPLKDANITLRDIQKEAKAIKAELTIAIKNLDDARFALDQAMVKEADAKIGEQVAQLDLQGFFYQKPEKPVGAFQGEGHAVVSTNVNLLELTDFSMALFFIRQDVYGVINNLSYRFAVEMYANLYGLPFDSNYSWKHSNAGLFSQKWNENKTMDFELKEYWIQYSPSIVDLFWGKRRLQYGTAKMYSPLDIINPFFVNSRYLSLDEESRIGSLMFSVTTHYPDELGYFQAFFMPIPGVNRFGKYSTKLTDDFPLSYKYFEGGFRTLFNIGNVTTSLIGMTIFDRALTDVVRYKSRADPITGDETFDPVYGSGRRYIVGVDLAAQIVSFFNVNFEFAFIMTDDLLLNINNNQRADDLNPLIQSSYLEGALELNFSILGKNQVYFSLLYSPRLVLNTGIVSPLVQYIFPFENLFGLKISAKALNGRKIRGVFEPEVQFLFSVPSTQWEGKASLGINFLPEWQIKIGARILGSLAYQVDSDYRHYGRFYVGGGNSILDKASTVYIELRYAW